MDYIQRLFSEDDHDFSTVNSYLLFLIRVWFHISRFIPGFPIRIVQAVRRVTRLLVLRSKRQYFTETTEVHKLHVFLRLVPNARFSRLCHPLQVSRHSNTLHVLQRLVLWYVFLRAAFLASFRVLCISYLFSRENAPFVHVYITLNILIG